MSVLKRIVARLEVAAPEVTITVDRLKLKKTDYAGEKKLAEDLKKALSSLAMKRLEQLYNTYTGKLSDNRNSKGDWSSIVSMARKPVIKFLVDQLNLPMEEINKGKIGRYGNVLEHTLGKAAGTALFLAGRKDTSDSE